MYPDNLKNLVNTLNLKKINKLHETKKGDFVTQCWVKIAKGDLIRKISHQKDHLTMAHMLYNEVIQAGSTDKTLPPNLIDWANYGNACLMMDSKRNLPHGLADKNKAKTLFTDIFNRTSDIELKQRCELEIAFIHLRGTKTHLRNIPEADKILKEIYQKACSKEIQLKAKELLDEISALASNYVKEHSFFSNYVKLVEPPANVVPNTLLHQFSIPTFVAPTHAPEKALDKVQVPLAGNSSSSLADKDRKTELESSVRPMKKQKVSKKEDPIPSVNSSIQSKSTILPSFSEGFEFLTMKNFNPTYLFGIPKFSEANSSEIQKASGNSTTHTSFFQPVTATPQQQSVGNCSLDDLINLADIAGKKEKNGPMR